MQYNNILTLLTIPISFIFLLKKFQAKKLEYTIQYCTHFVTKLLLLFIAAQQKYCICKTPHFSLLKLFKSAAGTNFNV